MRYLKQSTAATVKVGPFLDEDDGKTAETGLTISQADIRLSKNGGAFAQTNNATGATHDEAGWYGVPLDTTDTGTLGSLVVAIHESGALPVWVEFTVLAANVFDSLVAASDYLDANAAQVEGGDATDALEAAATASLDAYDPPTNTELEARTLVAASYFDPSSDQVLLSATAIDAIFSEVVEADDSITLSQLLMAVLAVCAGEASGAGTNTIVFTSPNGHSTRVTMTVDEDGNRSAIALSFA